MRGFYSIVMLFISAWMVYGPVAAGKTLGVMAILWIVYMGVAKMKLWDGP